MNRESYAKSLLWNANTVHHAECISKGVSVDHQTVVDLDGWARIGRYAAGMDSAHVQASKMRQRWPTLNINVRPPRLPDVEWSAEIWVKRKDNT